MNELQWTLVIVGGVLIAAMVAYNWWEDRRLRKQALERFGFTDKEPKDNPLAVRNASPNLPPNMGKGGLALNAGLRAEPAFPGSGVQQTTMPFKTDPKLEGTTSDFGQALATAKLSVTSDDTYGLSPIEQHADVGPQPWVDANHTEPAESLDKRLFADFYVRFEWPQESSIWLDFTRRHEHLHHKRMVYAAGVEHSDTGQMAWYQANPFMGASKVLRASIQLANRRGPITAIEFSDVLGILRRFAEAHNAEIEFPDMRDAVSKAESLDRAAAALDTLLGLHCLVPNEVDELLIAKALQDAKWTQQAGVWALIDETGQLSSMTMHKADGKRLLSFQIDVPHSADPIRSLSEIVTVCHWFNQQFGAPLLDDSGQTLNTHAIEGIYQQLLERVKHLDESGFAPGQMAARLLFS